MAPQLSTFNQSQGGHVEGVHAQPWNLISSLQGIPCSLGPPNDNVKIWKATPRRVAPTSFTAQNKNNRRHINVETATSALAQKERIRRQAQIQDEVKPKTENKNKKCIDDDAATL